MQTFSGDLQGVDYGDSFTKYKAPNTYDYTLSCNGASHVTLTVKAHIPAMIGEAPSSAFWQTVVDHLRCDAGNTVRGSFVVPEVQLSSQVAATSTEVEFHFARAALSGGVQYRLEIQHR